MHSKIRCGFGMGAHIGILLEVMVTCFGQRQLILGTSDRNAYQKTTSRHLMLGWYVACERGHLQANNPEMTRTDPALLTTPPPPPKSIAALLAAPPRPRSTLRDTLLFWGGLSQHFFRHFFCRTEAPKSQVAALFGKAVSEESAPAALSGTAGGGQSAASVDRGGGAVFLQGLGGACGGVGLSWG